MDTPHDFPSLIAGHNAKVTVIAGAGLSAPNLKTFNQLPLGRIAKSIGLLIDAENDNYKLAEKILEKIQELESKSDLESRLRLAEMLEILDDRAWLGEIGLPLSGNTPRHRVIARLAIEERIRTFISLNWDTLLEAALESVGLSKDAGVSRPWRVNAFSVVVCDNNIGQLGSSQKIFPVLKPHGCVRELVRVRREYNDTGKLSDFIFKLTKEDVSVRPGNQATVIDTNVSSYISQCPLIAVGWRASEDYLRDVVIRSAKSVKRVEEDPFTLVDIRWDDKNHTAIAESYGKNKECTFVRVGEGHNDDYPSCDNLFLWIQARYVLNRVIEASIDEEKDFLRDFLAKLNNPCRNNSILDWADSWVPTWTRLCWRYGVVRGADPDTGRSIEPWEIPVVPRDVHIPTRGLSIERTDLKAAGRLLVSLGGAIDKFDLKLYPGGLWNVEEGCLYLPLPAWGYGESQFSDLAALKPMVDALRGLGFARKICLLALTPYKNKPEEDIIKKLEAKVRRLMPISAFANSKSVLLSWANLEDLRGENDEQVA